MATALQILFSGLTVGAIYALVAIGFTLVYSSSEVVNFAQGEFVMLGGMISATAVAAGLAPLPAASLAIVATVVTGILLYGLAVAPARDASPIVVIIITIGASIFIRGLASVGMGKEFHTLPPLLATPTLDLGGASVQTQGLVVMAGSVAIVLTLWLFLRMTKLGRGIRATAANRLAAQLAGINPRVIVGLTFAISALIGALGGILITPITLTSFDVGTLLAVKGFAAAVLGGLTHPAGPVLGGLMIGLLEAVGAGYISSQYKDVFAFVVLLGVLFLRPQGILGGRAVERV
ncbi:branched-chain amino acid ABC transporter permease [Chelatococcus reniformis]|uniref:Branched-chain amino acid ABC transporter permease n=1 Tax=Chelatococcus reniformis TaxID=1494448 RepID=A0A916UU76_9HYPH|nr:branched-chain amino acid ABC transporter permease [Chelatococcus reniformis]GGC86982.1 branched-chain amino acid ABC transporter permease [Chelatococcus reniformis]